MNVHTSEIINQALHLSEDQRWIVTQKLLESLSPDVSSLSDDQWIIELKRRDEYFQQHPESRTSWEILKAESDE